MLVFRGGGYGTCMGSGPGAAEWAAANGMVGVECEYAAQNGGGGLGPILAGAACYPQCLADAARAIRLVRKMGMDGRPHPLLTTLPTILAPVTRHPRYRTGELPVDPERVIACGFSAGGHLAVASRDLEPRKPILSGAVRPAHASSAS